MAKKAAKKTAAKKAVKKISKTVPAKKVAAKAPAKKAATKAPAKKGATKSSAQKETKQAPATKSPAPKIVKKTALVKPAETPTVQKSGVIGRKTIARKPLLKRAAIKRVEDIADEPPIVIKRRYVAPEKAAKLSPFEKKQRQNLLDLRDQITDTMYGIQNDTIRNPGDGSDTSGSGMHQGDAGSDAYDRDFALSMLSNEANALGEIEEALHRLDLGIYGICEESGQKIPRARLEALPFARLTVECQAAKEKEAATRDYSSREFGFR